MYIARTRNSPYVKHEREKIAEASYFTHVPSPKITGGRVLLAGWPATGHRALHRGSQEVQGVAETDENQIPLLSGGLTRE